MTKISYISFLFRVATNLVFSTELYQQMTQHPHFLLDVGVPGPGCEASTTSPFPSSSISLDNCCPLRVLKMAVPFLAASRAATTRRTSTVLAVGQNR